MWLLIVMLFIVLLAVLFKSSLSKNNRIYKNRGNIVIGNYCKIKDPKNPKELIEVIVVKISGDIIFVKHKDFKNSPIFQVPRNEIFPYD